MRKITDEKAPRKEQLCPFCGKTFALTTMTTMKNHKRYYCRQNPHVMPPPKKACPFCQRKFIVSNMGKHKCSERQAIVVTDNEWEDCPVCLDNDPGFHLQCNHRYCHRCIVKLETCALCCGPALQITPNTPLKTLRE